MAISQVQALTVIKSLIATLGNKLVRFQNETVALFQDSLRDVMGSTKTDDLGRQFYLYLRKLWLSAHPTYFGDVGEKTLGKSPTECNRRSNPSLIE